MEDKNDNLSDEQLTKIIEYWIKVAEHDFETMESLFISERFSDTLFYGHLILEKILKAHVVNNTRRHALPVHNLLYLYTNSGLTISEENENLLAEANKFNIRARYPDFKLEFYKLCTKEYTGIKFQKIKNYLMIYAQK